MGSEPWAKQAKTNSIMCTTHYKTTERQYPEKKNDDSSISKGSIVVELIIMVTPGGSHRCLLSMIRDLSKKDVEYCWKLCKSRVQPIPHSYQYMQWQRTYKKHTCYVRLYLFLVSHRPCQPILSTMWLWLMFFVIGARYIFSVTLFCICFRHVTPMTKSARTVPARLPPTQTGIDSRKPKRFQRWTKLWGRDAFPSRGKLLR